MYDYFFRTRQLLRKQGPTDQRSSGASRIASIVSAQARVKTEKNVEDDTIVLDTTAEFCRQIGEGDQGEEGDMMFTRLCYMLTLEKYRHLVQDNEEDDMVSLSHSV